MIIETVKQFHNKHFTSSYNFNKDCTTPEQVRNESGVPFLMFDVDMPVDIILQEIEQAKKNFYVHRDDQSIGWSSLVMHGLGDDKTNSPQYYGIKEEDAVYDWTEASNSIPTLKKWLMEQKYFVDFDRVRIMALEPGGYIEPHNDYNKSKLGPINIAINNPDECYFVMENAGVIPFEPNKGAWLDLSNKHSVYNKSKQTRYHIILHGGKTTEFKQKAFESYRSLV